MNRERRALESLDQEIRDHIERETQDNIDRGMTPQEAHRAAVLRFGNVALVKEDTRAVWTWTWLEQLRQDVRFGVRTLAARPGFATAAVVTLALGIGATVTVFSLLDRVLLRPLPVGEPFELANVYTSTRRGDPHGSTSFLEFLDYRSQSRSFSDLAAFQPMTVMAVAGSESWVAEAMLVSDTYFNVLRVRPFSGQLSPPDGASSDPSVVLSHRVWTNRFRGRPGVAGTTVEINGTTFRIRGIAPPEFRGTRVGSDPDLWVPLGSQSVWAEALGQPDPLATRGIRLISGTIGRRRPGVSIEQAQAEMDVISEALQSTDPSRSGRFVTIEPAGTLTLWSSATDDIIRFIWLLMAAVGATLLIASANVAGLLLARGAARRREFELRRALGAGRARLVRQLCTEYGVLVVTGTAIGLAVALAALRGLARYDLPGGFPIATLELGLDSRVLTFAVGLMVLTGLFGLVPAVGSTAIRAAHSMSARGTREGTGGVARGQGLLLATQVAVSVVLLFGAGLFIRSLQAGLALDTGLDSRHVAMARLSPSLGRYSAEQTRAVVDAAVARLSGLPGVDSVAVSTALPLSRAGMGFFAEVDGYDAGPDEEIRIERNYVSAGYFRALGIDLLAGRALTAADDERAPLVAVVNETMARRYWPGQNPVGGRVHSQFSDLDVEVVGVARDVSAGLVAAPEPFVFLPQAQHRARLAAIPVTLWLLARGDGADAPLLASVRTVLQEIDPAVPLLDVLLLETRVAALLMPQRLGSALLSVLAGLAALLVVIGLVGSVSYATSRRRREIGIRLALGAQRVQLAVVMTRGAAVPVCLGLLAGLAAALALGRLVTSFLYGIAPTDGLTLVATLLVLSVVAGLAAYVPAHRATGVNPMEVLRAE